MNYSELKEKIQQFVTETTEVERIPTEAVLMRFLWWLYPKMEEEDLPSYGRVDAKPLFVPHHWAGDPLKQIPRHELDEPWFLGGETELYRIQHPERCPPVDHDGPPQPEPDCPLCNDTGLVDGYVACPRCG